MNRLWVRISLVIAGVAIFIALVPLIFRPEPPPWPAAVGEPRPPEFAPLALTEAQLTDIQQRANAMVWWRAVLHLRRTVAVGAVIGLVVGVWLSRGLIRPLMELEKGATAVARQDLTYRVPEKGSQEVRSLTRSFNQMAAELQNQESLRRNMLADVTHELRHPVHILQGNLQGILDGVFPLEMTEIAFLAEQTQHLGQLVNDLHELALAEAHELPLHKMETDLGAVVQDALEAIRPLAVEQAVGLRWERPSAALWLTIDPMRIRQVIQNLLSNAIRYTMPGGTISLILAQEAQAVSLQITDNGMGIAATDLAHIFDRFYRAAASRDRGQEGTGLGLAIAKAIVEAHHGRITASSPGPQQGSTFTVRLEMGD